MHDTTVAAYGACGVEGCTECLPLFDAENRELTFWPEAGWVEDASFVSHDDGATWVPLCQRGGPVELVYRFTPWGSWHCPACGMTYLIWDEDWPYACAREQDEDECKEDE
jgi:hypothetical protein